MSIQEFIEKHSSGLKYALAASRLKTYKKWPYDGLSNGCTSVKLAAAGFISTADPKDRDSASAACAFCGRDLEFDEEDDPWTEHSNRRPDCVFVKLNKRDERTWTVQDFLKIVRAAHVLETNKAVREDLRLLKQAETDLLTEFNKSAGLDGTS